MFAPLNFTLGWLTKGVHRLEWCLGLLTKGMRHLSLLNFALKWSNGSQKVCADGTALSSSKLYLGGSKGLHLSSGASLLQILPSGGSLNARSWNSTVLL